ncbi:PREDICTED: supervillin isoform X2 [Nicrophorus vespilloides]|uniref:Supervillin isoform X2 n=1 Tax=Nicrophorus vespilloides TaxID=110193 RepID=A0ABM1MSK5_NICVS|nr:PREDICTED: supervillin isoform X2 [Nicrophorus vespilloides]
MVIYIKSPKSPVSSITSPCDSPRPKYEKDKSSKRKSNLNRSLNCEEVPVDANDDNKNRRRRRRFFPPEVLVNSNEQTSRSDASLTANLSPLSSPITASATTLRAIPRKSELSIHMENARKGVTSAPSSTVHQDIAAKFNVTARTRRVVTSSPLKQRPSSDKEINGNMKQSNKENIKRKTDEISKKQKQVPQNNNDSSSTRSTRISKRMEELSNLTRETLARVERLANRSKESPKRDPPAKKKEQEVTPSPPVSILKRKVSQEESKTLVTPPVTFSPNVIEPATTNRKQGILKKRRSLDESQVLRHRSCSPDVAGKSDARSILKTKRRSSLEEITRVSTDGIQGILKRRTSRNEDDFDNSLNSPQSILKRRSGASSAGSSSSTHHHVSIATAVILAAAEGAEIILDSVKPILKKKSFSEDCPNGDANNDLKPILKKKSSTDTDDSEEKPKRPILKQKDTNSNQNLNDSCSECEVKPILKPRLSFGEPSNGEMGEWRTNDRRRSQTLTDLEFTMNGVVPRDRDRDLSRPRVISVSELVMSFEKSTGAIPKRSSLKRQSDNRYRTQPITFNEFEASLNYVQSPQREEFPRLTLTSPQGNNHSVQSLLDLTSSLENENRLSSYLSNSVPNTSSDSGVGKMSSDSAFQSLGDGLELEQDDTSPKKVIPKLEMQMKAIAEEAKKMKLLKVNAGIQKYKNRSTVSSTSRYSTQPVTLDEVQEAAKIKREDEEKEDTSDEDPCNLSLSERIKLFTKKQQEELDSVKLESPKRRTRFITQPVTYDEVKSAISLNCDYYTRSPSPYALDSESDRKGILKASPRHRSKSPPPPSPYKMLNSDPKPKSILKSESAAAVPDFTYDEGISSNDSDDTDTENRPGDFKINLLKKYSSSDESSGGKEIQSIIGREAMLKRRQLRSTNSNGCVIQKSKSQAGVAAEQQRQLAAEAAAAVAAGGIRKSKTTDAMRRIEKIQEQLKQSGDNDWKRRIPTLNNSNQEINLLNSRNLYNDELSDFSNLKAKKDELDASSKQWKSRVEKSDATNYSVTGRMQQIKDVPNISINISIADKVRRMPKAKRFKGKDGDDTKETISTPVSPEIDNGGTFRRSISVPNNAENDSSGSDSSLRSSGRKVKVTRPDDDTFQSFFQSVKEMRTEERVEVSLDDFDSVSRQTETLLVQKKNVRVQRRVKGASKNPLKVLAARSDIQSEYTEVATGIAERESKRLNVEKLARNSNLAMEALAGLASKEDFAAVSLKKGSNNHISYLPFNNMMLLQIKGRRHVQTRLVEPVATSINQGDNYILITPDALFNYIGSYSNVIEQSRAADIINHIQSTRDMGCKVEKAIVLGEKSYGSSKDSDKFWKLLNADEKKIVEAGHPDEDEVYETRMIDTNMIYYVENDELVPLEEYWGKIPKIEMLQPSRVLVFDFGSEMYVWSGKTANPDVKKTALNLAKQLWDSGYNYSDCELCPLNIANVLGARAKVDQSLKADARPDWAIFAKISQHRETILFREKFLDWPDYSRVIRVKDSGNEKNNSEATIDIKPCNANELICEYVEPNFETEGSLLGRGRNYFNEETNIHSEIKTLSVTNMRILENTWEELPEESKGHFYDGDSYIIRWKFRVTVTGRELSGKPSKHAQVGRDRCIYFYWLGKNSSMNEQGVAALLTIELDKVENAKQCRVLQGLEPPVFLQLFDGKMFVHSGKRDQDINDERLYICRGEVESESSLVEVPCSMRSLRSRTTFVYVNKNTVVVWKGCKASDQTKKVTNTMQEFILSEKPEEFGLEDEVELKVYEEGQEDESFLECLGEKRHLYESLLESNEKYEETMKLFKFNSIHGKFEVTETLCQHRSKDFVTPYPFLQSELYSANQPALYLLDNGHELWLWQGWWPERDTDLELSEQTGSGAIRWQAERKAAMQTAIDYWALRHPNFEAKTAPAFLVWAGLEPLSFTNLFPIWCDRDDIAGLNIKEGKKAGDKVLIEKELTLLTRTTYPLSELLQRPLPDGVNPTHLENYLSLEDFDKLLSMSKEEFQKLPIWKQNSLKKEKGLF